VNDVSITHLVSRGQTSFLAKGVIACSIKVLILQAITPFAKKWPRETITHREVREGNAHADMV